MQITLIEKIKRKATTSAPDKFPCFCCHDRNAVNFINVEIDSIDPHRLRLPVCDKCTEYAQRNPTWLEEALLLRRMKALNNNN